MKTMIKFFVKGLLSVVVPVTFCLILVIGFSALIAFVDQFDKSTVFVDTFREMMKHGFIWVVSVIATLGFTALFFSIEEDKRQARSMQHG